MELRERLSRHETGQSICAVRDLIADEGAQAFGDDRAAIETVQRPWRIVDRLGEAEVSELVRKFVAGATRDALVEHYSVSLSSVKRLLRQYGARPI